MNANTKWCLRTKHRINMSLRIFVLGLLVILFGQAECRPKQDGGIFTRTIRMPDAVSDRSDALMCHAMKLDTTKHQYILEYHPHAHKEVDHHMMLYGCPEPGSDEPYWSCGEMDDLPSSHSVCKNSSRQIIYAWALDAPAKKLPKGVGFRVGGDTGIHYIVLQMHYSKKFKAGMTDRSGVTVHMTYERQPKQAGFYVLGNWGMIPPHSDVHLESACEWHGSDVIHPFAYRTHSHNLGLVTSGYRIRRGKWTEIGRMSPQQPQMFYNTTNSDLDVKAGDILASRCTMHSDRDQPTIIGPTNHDEMCNFYIMYYTWRTENLRIQYCFRDSNKFKWDQYLKNIPKTASSLEGVHLMIPPEQEHRGHEHLERNHEKLREEKNEKLRDDMK